MRAAMRPFPIPVQSPAPSPSPRKQKSHKNQNEGQESMESKGSKATERLRAHSVSVVSPLDSLLHPAPDSATLFVGRIPPNATHATMRRTFRRYGPILDVLIFTKAAATSSVNTELNFGFVTFASGSSVEVIMGSAHSRGMAMAVDEPGKVQVELLVERRRDQRPNAIEKLTERFKMVSDPSVLPHNEILLPSPAPTRSQRGFRLSTPPKASRPRSHTFSAGVEAAMFSSVVARPRASPDSKKTIATTPKKQRSSPVAQRDLHRHQRHHSLVLSPEGRRKSGCGIPMRPLSNELDASNPWRSFLLKEFNWRRAAARYLYRQSTMEDYLAEYIHALAAYRGMREEPCSYLMNLLINLSDTCPEDPMHLMPPSISGLVYNQTKGRRPLSTSSMGATGAVPRLFRVNGILDRRPDLFRLSADQKMVFYRDSGFEVSAEKRLVSMLVEGLFVYFFAKFCHGASFPIAFGYYQRSEPVGSAIRRVSGCPGDVGKGLVEFFHALRDIFVFDREKSSLSLIADLYKEENKELTKRILAEPTLGAAPKRLATIMTGPDPGGQQEISPRSSTSEEEADIHNIVNTTLSPVHKAKHHPPRAVPRASQIHTLPFNVQSVVSSVLRTDSEEDLRGPFPFATSTPFAPSNSCSSVFPEMLNLPMFDSHGYHHHDDLPTPDSRGSRQSSSFSFEDDVFEDSGVGGNDTSVEGEADMLLTNPKALDSILDKMLQKVNIKPAERGELKVKFEAESRQTIARLLVAHGAGDSNNNIANKGK